MTTGAVSDKTKTELLSAFVDGCVVDPCIGYPRFEVKLSAQDLGLKPEDVPEIFKLGKKQLIDQEEIRVFQRIESRARREVEFYSFSFPIPGLRFVPHRVLNRLVESMESIKREFNEAAAEFVGRYEDLKADMLTKYAQYRSALERLYPARPHVADSFHFSYAMFSIALPTKLQRKAVDLKTSEAAVTKANEIVAQKTRELVGSFDKWAEEIVMNARQAALEMFRLVKEKLDGGEVINAKSIESLKGFIDRFRDLNFVGDERMEKALVDAKSILDAGMNTRFAKDQAKQVIGQVVQAASDVSDVSQVTGAYRRRMLEE